MWGQSFPQSRDTVPKETLEASLLHPLLPIQIATPIRRAPRPVCAPPCTALPVQCAHPHPPCSASSVRALLLSTGAAFLYLP